MAVGLFLRLEGNHGTERRPFEQAVGLSAAQACIDGVAAFVACPR